MLLIGGMSKEYELNSIDAFRTRLAYLKMTDDMQPDIYLSLVANKQIGITGFKLKLKKFFGHLAAAKYLHENRLCACIHQWPKPERLTRCAGSTYEVIV